MTMFSLIHIIFLIVTILIITMSIVIIRTVKPKIQNIIFIIIAFLCSFGIFYRYALDLSLKGNINLARLLLQLLQVCNFNFILLPLMLVPKFELVRQYSIFFSMFASMTTFIAVPSAFKSYNWYDQTIINSWLNHLFAILLPILMIASKRLKPNKKYILKVTLLVIIYFTLVYIISSILKQQGTISQDKNFSFIYNPEGVPILTTLYKLIPIPYIYLYPLLPPMIIFFYILSKIFNKYEVNKYKYNN